MNKLDVLHLDLYFIIPVMSYLIFSVLLEGADYEETFSSESF